MFKRILTIVFCFIMIFTQLIQSYCSSPSPSSTQTSLSYITLDLDKTNVKLGDIIKASVRVNEINMFAGYQVRIKYDPKVLQVVNPFTGEAYNEKFKPSRGDILLNEVYKPLSVATISLEEGILEFGRAYLNSEDYVKSGVYETTGVTDVIGFKVISSNASCTNVQFTDGSTLPGAVSGTIICNGYNKTLTSKDYYVFQPSYICLNGFNPKVISTLNLKNGTYVINSICTSLHY